MHKQKIHNQFLSKIKQSIDIQKTLLKELAESAANETKSTAGDKYETALAMLQIEQAQTNKKLDELNFQLTEINQIDVSKVSNKVIIGSLVKTNQGYFYVSTALGKLLVDDVNVFALSIKSPLGIVLINKINGDNFTFKNTEYTILEIL